MSLRNYSSTAADTTLAAAANSVDTSLDVAATTGFPSPPYILEIDPDASTRELVLVTGASGTTLTVTRGYDSTVPATHSSGVTVRHAHAALDFREANTHVNSTDGVHGVTGSVVGTNDAQVLTNKDLSGASNTFPTDVEDAASRVGSVTGSLVGTNDTQTLSNKSINVGSNTVTGTKVEHDATVSDDTGFVYRSEFGAPAAYMPTLNNMTLGDGTVEAYFTQIGKLVHCRGLITFGSTTSISGTVAISFPVAPVDGTSGRALGGSCDLLDSSALARRYWFPRVQNSTAFAIVSSTDTTLDASDPWAWASGDTIDWSFTYEAA